MDHVRLGHGPGCRTAALREITGLEEQQVAGTTTVDALQLLERLLVEIPGSLLRENLVGLTAFDRDRLLAAVYRRTYGNRVASSAVCAACRDVFDLHFSLSDLLDSLTSSGETQSIQRQPDGTYLLPDGSGFRLPTTEDELALIGLAPEDARTLLVQRSLLPSANGDLENNAEGPLPAIQSAMAAAAPLVAADLDARCPECSHLQQVHFDLQHYLLQALCNDRRRLMLDVHVLAATYGWGLNEIMGLARSQRTSLVAMVEMGETFRQVE